MLKNQGFHNKKLKNISVASCVADKKDLRMAIEIYKNGLYFDPILNQKLVQGFHTLKKKLLEEDNFDILAYKIAHRFIGSTARGYTRDTFDKRVKKELVQLMEDNGVYPYTT